MTTITTVVIVVVAVITSTITAIATNWFLYRLDRRTEEKELRLAEGYVLTLEEYEACGATYLGTLDRAAKAGYYTPRGCEKRGKPVTEDELANITHCAAFTNYHQDRLVREKDYEHLLCLPVFYRETPREPRHREG